MIPCAAPAVQARETEHSKNSNALTVGKYPKCTYLRGRFSLLPPPFLTHYALLEVYIWTYHVAPNFREAQFSPILWMCPLL